MRLRTAVLLVFVAAAIAAAAWFAPPPTQRLIAASPPPVRGALHVHTRRSDGSGTIDDVAAAAAKAGLQFIVLTDHGDGTRTPDAAVYQHGVLVIDAVEISANDGHVVALGLSKTPYPLGGDARDIVEDIARLGGMSIAAHPGSAKPELRWTEWASPFDGIEWLNADSESRDEPWHVWARALLTYPMRPGESLATMLDRPDGVLRRWDVLTARRRVVAVAASDAHARLDVSSDGSIAGPALVRLPSYESMFRTFSMTLAGVRLTGSADADARTVVDAIRQGHVYSTIDALATPGVVSFRATRAGSNWISGDFVPLGGGEIDLEVDGNIPSGSRIVLLKGDTMMSSVSGQSLRARVPSTQAVYRVEIQRVDAPGSPPVPWVVTNPIYVRTHDEVARARSAAAQSTSRYDNGAATGWRIETSPRSHAALDVVRSPAGTELLLRWAIGGTRTESPYAAFAMPAGPELSGYDRLMFTGRADRPTRLSVQFRTDSGERWRRSVFVDDQARQLVVFFDDLRPAGVTSQRRVALAAVRDVLFVVDSVNMKPGASGQFWIDDVKYGR
jgi:hypothetical protein